MDVDDIFWLSYRDLSEKKVRTILTIIMVIIGIAAIVALTSVTAGISASITKTLESLGPTAIIVSSGTSTGFTAADVGMMASLPNVTAITPLLIGSAILYAGNQNTSVSIIGVSTQGLAQLLGSNLTVYEGSMYEDTISPAVVVGHSVAFPSSAAGQQTIIVGQSAALRLNGGRGSQTVTVPILGILSSHGASLIPIDTGVFMSVQAAEVLLHRSSFNEMVVLSSNLSSVNATSSLITTIYGSSARVTTTSQLLSTTSSIIGSITLLFSVIAGVSLLVAAVGIMNVMLMGVMERTHEIGVMKSIGFKNKHVMFLFLLQALIIGVVGGLAGIGVGAGASYALSTAFSGASTSASASAAGASGGSGFRTAGGGGGFGGGASTAIGSGSSSSGLSFTPAFQIETIITALLVAIMVSIIAGIYPAWRASRMEPIDALRQL
jgi:putative ABC transport system permease protein